MKEIILIIFAIVSVIIIAITLPQIKKMNIGNAKKNRLIYLTLVVPILGFIVSNIMIKKIK